MRIIGCDLHARQQTVAMLDTTTGEVVRMTLTNEGDNVREFYSKLLHPVRVGIEATGSMQWFVNLMEELGIECRVGHPAEIRAAEPRKQKHDQPVTALATEVFLGDPSRFRDGKALASYVGMIPSEYSSGSRQRLGGLSKQGNPLLRFLWGEAAMHAVRRDHVQGRIDQTDVAAADLGPPRRIRAVEAEAI